MEIYNNYKRTKNGVKLSQIITIFANNKEKE
jgi:hypothetical protein